MMNVTLLIGNDVYMIEKNVSHLLTERLSEVATFNISHMNAEELKLSQLVMHARTLPFGGDQRVSIVRNFQALATANKGKRKCSQDELDFIDYVKESNESHVLLLACEMDSLNGVFLKNLAKDCEVIQCDRPAGVEWETWVLDIIRPTNHVIARDALAFIVENAQHMTTSQLASEVLKACLYFEDDFQLTRSMLMRTFSPTSEHTLFQLIDAIVLGKADQALLAWRALAHIGEKPSTVLYRLSDGLQTILAVQALQLEKRTPKDMATQLGKHPFVIKKSLASAKRIAEPALVRGLRYLLEQDVRLKTTSGLDAKDMLEETIVIMASLFK